MSSFTTRRKLLSVLGLTCFNVLTLKINCNYSFQFLSNSNRFIREGECSTTSCPFSHILEPHKMPDCLFYLQGRCNAQTCPYRHVNVSKDAKVCLEFNNGFCAKGDQVGQGSERHGLFCSLLIHLLVQ